MAGGTDELVRTTKPRIGVEGFDARSTGGALDRMRIRFL
jgi:hypothetical protein